MESTIIASDLPICDFCSKPGVKWTAFSTAAEMTVTDPKKGISTSLNSDDEWAVCDECVRFLRANDHEGLAKRSHETDPMPGEGEAILSGKLKHGCFHRSLHEGLFWPGFKGRIEACNPDERMVTRFVKLDWGKYDGPDGKGH